MQEVEDSPQRKMDRTADVLTRKYLVRAAGIPSSIPAFGAADGTYTTHQLAASSYAKVPNGDLYSVTLEYRVPTYEGNCLIATAPLPPDEVEYIAGTTERHIGAHPSYQAAWLGTPTTTGVAGATADPRGIPTTTATKPGKENYLIPTGIYRKTSYTHVKPQMSIQKIGKRNIPSGETGTNQWLYTGYTLRITKGVYQVSEEWTFLPIGTWDTDIYEVG